MDAKTVFLNVDFKEKINAAKFIAKREEHLACKLKKPIYGSKQTTIQWYMKFDLVIKSSNCNNVVHYCITSRFVK